MKRQDRTDYIVHCLMDAAAMYEDGARTFLAEHDADVLREAETKASNTEKPASNDSTPVLEATDSGAACPSGRSIRPVIEHALTIYYEGNAELVRTLIDKLLSEKRSQ